MGRVTQIFETWSKVIELLRRAAPKLSIGVAVLTILEAITGIAVLYIIKILVDTITVELTDQNDAQFSNIVIVLAFTGLAFLLAAFFQSVANVLRMRQGLLVSDHVDREIHDRAISVDLRFYESPKYYDALERARHGGTQRPAKAVANVVVMFRAALTLAAIFILIVNIEWRLIPILALPIAIAVIVRLYFTRKLFDWRMSRAQKERRATYLDWLMTNVRHAKDLRINRIGPYLRDQFRGIRTEIRKGEIQIEQSRHLSEFLFSTIGAILFIGASAWLLQQSLQQGRQIGDVVLFVLLLRRAETSGKELVSNISMIVDDHLYLNRLFEFLSVEPKIQKPATAIAVPTSLSKGFEVSDISFKYDGADRMALQSVSLQIEPEQIVALVGENGSGKTTLIKLLTRLYDPSEGKIMLDGVDIRDFDPDAYRKLMSVIFQDYSTYAETVEDNIRYGDIEIPHSRDKIELAARNAGATDFINSLPHGFKTPLTKLFDNGQDLSIGQWQRLALARAFYPESKLLILDEPTSAVDPKAEYELFENFRQRLDGRSALIISHRLSTIRQADYTYVMEGGEIVEHGTHDALVRQRGKYADLFEKQAQHYR